MLTISMYKQYKTREGRPVRILCTNRKDTTYPVCGLITLSNGTERFESWTLQGIAYSNNPRKTSDFDLSDFDLVEAKPRIKRKIWVNVYPRTTGVHESWKSAEIAAAPDRIACVEINIDVEEGHGLD